MKKFLSALFDEENNESDYVDYEEREDDVIMEKRGEVVVEENNKKLAEIRKKRDAEEMTKMANGLSADDARTICDVIVKKYPSVIFASLESEFDTNRQFINRMKDMVKGEC